MHCPAGCEKVAAKANLRWFITKNVKYEDDACHLHQSLQMIPLKILIIKIVDITHSLVTVTYYFELNML